jgi:hypothetical protein
MAFSFDEDYNVLSYYAAGNTLDGQPMVDKTNILRFYPIYSMRNYQGLGLIDEVIVTLYYGNEVASRKAAPKNNGQYWEVYIPKLQLGESIQRIDIETRVTLRKTLLIRDYIAARKVHEKLVEQKHLLLANLNELKSSKKNIEKIENNLNNIKELIQKNLDSINSLVKVTANLNQNVTYYTQEIGERVLQEDTIDDKISKNISNIKKIVSEIDKLDAKKDTLTQLISDVEKNISSKNLFSPQKNLRSSLPDFSTLNIINQGVMNVNESNQNLGKKVEELFSNFSSLSKENVNIKVIDSAISNFKQTRDDLYAKVIGEISGFTGDETSLAYRGNVKTGGNSLETVYHRNATYSNEPLGESVYRYDIILDTNLTLAKVLYRYHKGNLRQRMTIDPQERIGVFRFRYVPFAITGNTFRRPFNAQAQGIFEFGLTFGDNYVRGDDFDFSPISFNRLGFSVAITEEFFSDKAEVAALCLTYDFNSYGSIGLGINFPHKKDPEPYFSFGINQRLFEVGIKRLSQLLGGK